MENETLNEETLFEDFEETEIVEEEKSMEQSKAKVIWDKYGKKALIGVGVAGLTVASYLFGFSRGQKSMFSGESEGIEVEDIEVEEF